jgi:hypothetical protein
MNAYVPFDTNRKALIADLKAMLTHPEMKPFKDKVYGTKYPRLFLKDYAVYAALRGADYRKTSHLRDQGAPNAKEALESVLADLKGSLKRPEDLAKRTFAHSSVKRYVIGMHAEGNPEKTDLYVVRAESLIAAIEAALA